MKRLILLPILLFSLSTWAQTQQELRDSLAAATERLAFHPDSIDLRLIKAGWNIQLQQWDYAKEEYDYVLKLDKKNISALYFRAFVNTKLGRYNFARLDYETLLTIVPGHFEAQLGLALLNEKDQHYTEALDLLNSLCENYPHRAEAFAARGGVEMDHKMFTPAEFDYTQAIDLEPNNVDYRLARADARIKLGRKDEAREDLDYLVSIGVARPRLAEFYERAQKKVF